MKRKYIGLAVCLVLAIAANAQNVAINGDGSLPDPNAALDIKAVSKGLLIPRVSSSARLIIPNTKGLLVYDTTTGSFWYNTGAAWQNMVPVVADGASAWSLTGNSGTNAQVHFLGTTDSASLLVKVNNHPSGRIDLTTRNTFWGYYSGNGSIPNISDVDTDSGYYSANTAIGYAALSATTTGRWNVASGMGALYANTTGIGNTATGAKSLFQGNANLNTATGFGAMETYGTGSFNTASGAFALAYHSTGDYNTAMGHMAMAVNETGVGNTAMGAGTMGRFRTGNNNTVVGYEGGNSINQGNSNTTIGAYADIFPYLTGISNATAIGYGAIANASNKVRIGNSAVTVIEGQVPFTTPSDGRFKFQVQEDVKGLDFILKLRPVTYRFDVGRFDAQHGNPQEAKGAINTNYALQTAYNEASLIRRSGFIAQEVEKAAKASGYDFSGIITPKTEQEHYSLSYESFVVPLVKAVQEQQKTIDEQNKTIAGLQQQLNEIKQLLQHTK